MSLPFFEHAADRLHEIIKPGMLCAFDFDGTLAPVVKEPARACVPAAVVRRLSNLSQYVRVAVITGRSVDDVCARLHFTPDFVIGNHGIEGVPGWEAEAEHYRALCHEWEQRLNAALEDRAVFESGIWIENKACSLSVHYRMTRDRSKAEHQLRELFARLQISATVMHGKCVFNLLPPSAPNKGTALSLLCEASGAPSAFYVGDDVTDEDVFNMDRPDWLTVRIERALGSGAEFYLHHRLDMVQLLDVLIEQLSHPSFVSTHRQRRLHTA